MEVRVASTKCSCQNPPGDCDA